MTRYAFRMLGFVGLLAGGCSFNTTGLSPSRADRPAGSEGGARDAASDLRYDAASDVPVSDQLGLEPKPVSDSPRSDLPPKQDLPKQDLAPKPDLAKPKPDLAKPDLAKPDLPKPDLPKPKPDLPKPDLTPPEPCASGAPSFTFQTNMVICVGASSDQCGAAKACNAAGGWHLCTASEYLARGGKTAHPTGNSWLASCIRSGGAPHAPTDVVCTSCGGGTGGFSIVEWNCAMTEGISTNALWIGVIAQNACARVGTSAVQHQANWGMSYASTKRTQSVCCK